MHNRSPITPREIVAQPTAQHTPQQRMLAWAVLKAERGQIVLQHRLPRSTARKAS